MILGAGCWLRPLPPTAPSHRSHEPPATAMQYAASDVELLPTELRVIGEIKAGAKSDLRLGRGGAVCIMTGAAAPPGADAVVMIEHTTRHGDQVEIQRAIEAGANIVSTGSEARQGEQLLSPGALIDHAAIAVAASTGRSSLKVFTRPRVAILATGD